MKFSTGRPLLFASACVSLLLVLLSSCAADHNRQSKTESTARPGQIPTRDGRNSVSTTGEAANGANGPEYRVATGTTLPQNYNRKGYTTDREDPSFIYDNNDIRLQHTNNVQDSLRDVPGVDVRGTR